MIDVATKSANIGLSQKPTIVSRLAKLDERMTETVHLAQTLLEDVRGVEPPSTMKDAAIPVPNCILDRLCGLERLVSTLNETLAAFAGEL